MRMISEHITIDEVSCNCGCGFGDKQGDLQKGIIDIFEEIRQQVSLYIGIDTPIYISSGCRCEAYNSIVSKAKDSFHTKGQALDILCPEELEFDKLLEICTVVMGGSGGLGIHRKKNFIHIDNRTKVWRKTY